jgi:glucose-6-phosphate 1-epimerase
MPAKLTPGNNGLEKIVLESPHGTAEIYRLGATLTRYAVKGREIIFVSAKSPFTPGKAIRGGVPICWPWFGPHPSDPKLPQHGLARNVPWRVTALEDQRAILELTSSPETKPLFPFDFKLRYIITLGQDGLSLALESTNTDASPFTFGEALHTYFHIGDIRKTSVSGFTGLTYLSKSEGNTLKTDTAERATLSAETDRVYANATGPHEILSPAGRIFVHKSNSHDTVLWNPWEPKAETMPDLSGNQWPTFVCVEAVNTAQNSITLAPHQTHTTTCRIEPV